MDQNVSLRRGMRPINGAADELSESVGAFLKREREMRGIALDVVAQTTRIHIDSLRALEEDDRSRLPAEVYVRGFIRNYAACLGIDPDDAIGRYEHGRGNPSFVLKPMPDTHEVLASENRPAPPRFIPAKIIFFFCILSIALTGAYFLIQKYSLTEKGGLLSARINQVSVSPVRASGTPAPVPSAALSSEATEKKVKGTEDHGPSRLGLDPKEVGGQEPLNELKTASPSKTDGEPTAEQMRGDGGYVLMTRFTEMTWLRVWVDSETPEEFTFHPGDQREWKANEKIDLFVGNAGGIDLTLNGKHMGVLGRSGTTARFSTLQEKTN